MYDSVTPSVIPSTAAAVGGYVDGSYKWSDADWASFPHAYKKRITATGLYTDGDILDVEPGDATPDYAPGWVKERSMSNHEADIYCSLSTVMQVIAAMKTSSLPYKLWVAHYNGIPHICSTQCLKDENWVGEIPEGLVMATQYIDHGPNGENYDISLCRPEWFNS